MITVLRGRGFGFASVIDAALAGLSCGAHLGVVSCGAQGRGTHMVAAALADISEPGVR